MNLLAQILTLLQFHRRPKAYDKIHFQSPDDAVTFDGCENPEFGNPLYLNPDELENFEETTTEPPPDDGTI